MAKGFFIVRLSRKEALMREQLILLVLGVVVLISMAFILYPITHVLQTVATALQTFPK